MRAVLVVVANVLRDSAFQVAFANAIVAGIRALNVFEIASQI
jgi:hypothetical protein